MKFTSAYDRMVSGEDYLPDEMGNYPGDEQRMIAIYEADIHVWIDRIDLLRDQVRALEDEINATHFKIDEARHKIRIILADAQ